MVTYVAVARPCAAAAACRRFRRQYSAHHADVTRANIAHAGLAHCVDARVGAALDLLPQR